MHVVPTHKDKLTHLSKNNFYIADYYATKNLINNLKNELKVKSVIGIEDELISYQIDNIDELNTLKEILPTIPATEINFLINSKLDLSDDQLEELAAIIEVNKKWGFEFSENVSSLQEHKVFNKLFSRFPHYVE